MRSREKELQELNRRKAELKKAKPAHYFILIFIILIVIMMIDEFASNTNNSVQTAVIDEFFVKGMGQTAEEGAASFSIVTSLTMPISILAVIFVTLCDYWGRKPILIASVIGMGAAMFTATVSRDFTTYLVSRILTTFFIATDVHQIYMMEIVPQDKRATYINTAGAFGMFGNMMISFARMLNTHNEVLNWRGVYLIPTVVSVISTVVLFFVARETEPFLETRIAYLEKDPEVRKEEKEKAKLDKAVKSKETGIVPAFKYIIRNRSALFTMLAMLPTNFAMLTFSSFYEMIMTMSGMSTSQVSAALFIYPIAGALMMVLIGWIADKFGRKPSALITGITAVVSLLLFVYAAQHQFHPYLVGIFYGIEIRCYWGYYAMLGLSFKENIPTHIRASSGSVTGIWGTLTMLFGSLICAQVLQKFGFMETIRYWSIAMMSISLVIFCLFAKETKGINLEEIE